MRGGRRTDGYFLSWEPTVKVRLSPTTLMRVDDHVFLHGLLKAFCRHSYFVFSRRQMGTERKTPRRSSCGLIVVPFAGLVAVTVAPGITAPVGSKMVP